MQKKMGLFFVSRRVPELSVRDVADMSLSRQSDLGNKCLDACTVSPSVAEDKQVSKIDPLLLNRIGLVLL